MRGKMQRNRNLGELPSVEYPLEGPYGVPPPANDYIPTSSGGIASGADLARAGLGAPSLFQVITFTADIQPKKIQDFTLRKYFLLQNKSNAGTIYIGFGYQPNANNGIVIPPGVAYEPLSFPVNEIWVSSDVDGTLGLLIFGS